MNAPPRRLCHSCLSREDVPIKVSREVERTFPRLKSTLVCARDEISGRIDKSDGLFIQLRVRLGEGELEAHVEEVPSRECVSGAAITGTRRCGKRYR